MVLLFEIVVIPDLVCFWESFCVVVDLVWLRSFFLGFNTSA